MTLVLVLGILTFAIVGLGFYTLLLVANLAQAKKELRQYQENYLHRQGGGSLSGYPSYHLFSLDGGITWYALQENQIVGRAEGVYLGLLANLAGIDNLIAHVAQNGPIGSRPITEADTAALKGAGFSAEGERDYRYDID